MGDVSFFDTQIVNSIMMNEFVTGACNWACFSRSVTPKSDIINLLSAPAFLINLSGENKQHLSRSHVLLYFCCLSQRTYCLIHGLKHKEKGGNVAAAAAATATIRSGMILKSLVSVRQLLVRCRHLQFHVRLFVSSHAHPAGKSAIMHLW